jgi:hypothetical protein
MFAGKPKRNAVAFNALGPGLQVFAVAHEHKYAGGCLSQYVHPAHPFQSKKPASFFAGFYAAGDGLDFDSALLNHCHHHRDQTQSRQQQRAGFR